MRMTRTEKAQAFCAMHAHHGEMPLVLLNAWDCSSAQALARAGAPAIGTTSAGMAWAAGYQDGEHMPVSELLHAIKSLCEVVDLPITVDVESGYADRPQDVADLVGEIGGYGVVGVNIEDGFDVTRRELRPASRLAERIAAIRDRMRRSRLPLFINARTDTYFAPLEVAQQERFELTRVRLATYEAAGADGVFVPGMRQLEEIAKLVAKTNLPVNIYASAGTPAIGQLAMAGVRRISFGCGPMQAALGTVRRVALEALSHGTYELMLNEACSASEINGSLRTRMDDDTAARRNVG